MLASLASCRGFRGPEATAEEYARALRENRLEEAYALTSHGYRSRMSRDAFAARYAEEARRQERAAAALEAAKSMTARSGELELVLEGGAWRIEEIAPTGGPREALAQFLAAVELGDFSSAYQMLAGSWRARYTPERLRADFEIEPLARERLARARAALSSEPRWNGEWVQFPLGEGRAVRLVREGGVFKVGGLE